MSSLSIGHEIIAAGWYVGPTVVNIVTAGAQLAEMKLAEHHWLLPTGAKTVGKGGSGAGDKLSVVVAQSSWPTLFRSKDEN